MKFIRTCREVTHLVLQEQDRELSLGERWGLQFHMLICKACPNFVKQARLMRSAMGRWKQYRESE